MRNTSIRYELPHDYYRDVVSRYQGWIEEVLCAPFSESVIVEVGFPFDRFFLSDVFPGANLRNGAWRTEAAGMSFRRWTPAEGETPLLELEPVEFVHPDPKRRVAWHARWGQTPVAVWFQEVEQPVVFMHLHYVDYERSIGRSRCTLMIVRRHDLATVTAALGDFIAKRHPSKSIYVVNGKDESLTETIGWDDLILDSQVTNLVRADFETFIARRRWFEENRIPFRRGYLLYGPPGNGKTSVVRALASQPQLSVTTLNWGKMDTDDSDLSELFSWAADHAPTLIVMEDLDRHFSQSRAHERKHNISLAHLLNCLDGISSGEGIIVVATANDPGALDSAILRRPGRFDRVVEFKSPCRALRGRYIKMQLRGACTEAALDRMAEYSAGFSFAQLREAYILAGQLAFEQGGEVTEAEMSQAILQMAPISGRSANRAFQQRAVGFPSRDTSEAMSEAGQ